MTLDVVVPAFNAAAYLPETLAGLRAQTHTALNVYVVDDQSTDDTAAIAGTFGWPVTGVLRHDENRGGGAALNTGLRAGRAPYVAWCSADDVWEQTKAAEQIAYMERHPAADATFTDFYSIDERSRRLESIRVTPAPNLLRQILTQNIINGSSVVLRRDVFDRVGYFREDLRADVDGDLWMRMLAEGLRIDHLPRLLLSYRTHPAQLSRNTLLMHRSKDRVRADCIDHVDPVRLFGERAHPDDFRALARVFERKGLSAAAAACHDRARSWPVAV